MPIYGQIPVLEIVDKNCQGIQLKMICIINMSGQTECYFEPEIKMPLDPPNGDGVHVCVFLTYMDGFCSTCLACLSLTKKQESAINQPLPPNHATPPHFTMLASTSGVLMWIIQFSAHQ